MQYPRAIALELRAIGALGRLRRPALGVTRVVVHHSSLAYRSDILPGYPHFLGHVKNLRANTFPLVVALFRVRVLLPGENVRVPEVRAARNARRKCAVTTRQTSPGQPAGNLLISHL